MSAASPSKSVRKPRARELGLPLPGTPGPHNAITDVPGVLVGFTTLVRDAAEGDPAAPQIRTGVTAVLPRGREEEPRPVWAGVHALNGNGEMTGTHWIRDGGYFLGPICLTNTHSVGVAHHAAVRWMIRHYGPAWKDRHLWAMPVVAETYDGALNDINGQHVTEAHVLDAIAAAAGGPPAEGNVGGGTGMICYEFKGGTGSASRRVEAAGRGWTVAALVQANHGIRPWLTICGRPVGQRLTEDRLVGDDKERGSIIVLIATDAPMLPHQLDRLARRGGLGIARGGSPSGNGSGDIFLAFSTANAGPLPQFDGPLRTMQALNDQQFDPFYLAAVECVEEAVLNAMLAAEDTPVFRPRDGTVCRALDGQAVLELLG
jgi:D-aminopeptidase